VKSKAMPFPSVAEMAHITGRYHDLYAFLYHASSRAVHFSTGELLRRVWGEPGKLTIRSAHYSEYWSAFALHWGAMLYLDFLNTALALTPRDPGIYEEVDIEGLGDAIQRAGMGGVPIITEEELDWPDNPWAKLIKLRQPDETKEAFIKRLRTGQILASRRNSPPM
jgi:hypothetical protein